MRSRGRSRGLLATALTLFAATALAQPKPPSVPGVAWNNDDWNPNADPAEDIVIPLPCKGAMTFRRVLTGPPRQPGKGNQLEDREVVLGSADEPQAYVGYLRSEHIAGGFYMPNTGARYYLIGKFEVTVQQYEAVMGDGSCKPTPSERAALPMSNVSWFDAVEFTRRLNKWLYAERLDAVPKSEGVPGYVRLPSEMEWEFAARGGMAVSDAERANPTFLPPGANLSEYAWYAGPESSAGSAKPIGSVKPNPLKLYDMLGNVEEIMLEPFRLNRVGRPHGQLGGIVVRGGSFMTPRDAVRTSVRTEFPLFQASAKGETRLPTFGFRVVVDATAFGRTEDAAAYKKAWEEASRSETQVAGKNPVELLEAALKHATTPSEKAQIQAAIDQVKIDARIRNELQESAIKSLLQGALTNRSSLNFAADLMEKLIPIIEDGKKPGADKIDIKFGKDAEARFKEQKQKFDAWSPSYADLIKQIAAFRDPDIKTQAASLKADLTARGRGYEGPGLDAILADVFAYRAGMQDTSKILRSAVGPRKWLAQ